MTEKTPTWEKAAILVSALAALIAAIIALYQGCQMREAIQIDYSTTRPFLVIEPVSQSSDLKTLVLQAKNTGSIPARVLYESGKTWLDRTPLRTSVDSRSRHVLYPNEIIIVSEILLDDPTLILEGKQRLKIGFCLLYESVSPDDSRRWVAESWFFFNPKNRKLQVWKRDESTVKHSEDSCHVDSLIPDKWLETLSPPWEAKLAE
jgi:hypothetical protein